MKTLLRRLLIVALIALICGVFYWHALATDRVVLRQRLPDGRQSVTLLSRVHTIDRIYQSMQGPYTNHAAVRLADDDKRGVVFLTGIRSELVGADGVTPISREFFCHSNLVLSPSSDHGVRDKGPFTPIHDDRLFTLIPGRLGISLPHGFGIPIYCDELVDYFSMSLNLNMNQGSQRLRFKTTVDFVAADSAAGTIRPLFRRALYGFEPIGTDSPHTICQSSIHPGAACGPFVTQAASKDSFVASLGKTNTIHWMIPPGHYESRVPINEQLNLPFDTTVHYVTAHLHPFGKSVSLVDKTTGQSIFGIESRDFSERLGVETMHEISLPGGVQLSKDHEYELVTIYHNPTDKPIDAMSILYLYCLDKKFEAARSTPPAMARR
ncbi:MAG: hypothetical protein ACREJC_17560 [Tepidisphaeraceae bacterium]